MPTVATAVVEIGPATVRRIAPSVAAADPSITGAALAGIDDPVVLLDERPVDGSALWRSVIESVLESSPERLTIVVPSWWPQRRVERVTEAAAGVGAEVGAVQRSRVFGGEDVVVVELADEVIAVSAGDSIALLPRSCDTETVARSTPDAARIVIDAPVGVIDVDESARLIRSVLEDRGRAAEIAPIIAALPTPQPVRGSDAPRGSPFTPAIVAGAVVAAVMCAVGVATVHPASSNSPSPAADTTDLIEGRITVRVPLRWEVTRVTTGPGSRRVQVTSTDDRDVALHITQSYVPGESPEAAAAVLRRELDKQPAGVFTDFRPHDQRAGRGVVSYREQRAARAITWAVLVDGSTRIAIGCQSPAGRADAIDEACDEAVRSAREITGTIVAR